MKSILFCFVSLLACALTLAAEPVPRPFQAIHYKLEFTLDRAAKPATFPAVLELSFKPKEPIHSIELDRKDLTIENVEWVSRSVKLAFDVSNPKLLKIQFPQTLKPGTLYSIRIAYVAQIHTSHDGLFWVDDPDAPKRGRLYFTQFESQSARSAYPCDDVPDDKATSEVVATVPFTDQVLSNGAIVSDTKVTREGKLWHEIHWKTLKPHSTYLLSLAIGPFAEIATNDGGKEISLWVGKDKKEQARYALSATQAAYDYYEKYLGVRYPWEKYATVGIPTFLWGGMENVSSTHMNEQLLLLPDSGSEASKALITMLTAHELAHQWFGDYVTMKWWNDIWLNESFASFMATQAQDAIFHNDEGTLHSITSAWHHYFQQEDGPRSHPMVDNSLTSPDDAFDSISYTKGENILRMLKFYLGDAKFQKGLNHYLKRFAFSNATYRDFFETMSAASGVDLSSFRDTWMLQRGYPVLTYEGVWNEDKHSYHFSLNQRANHSEDHSLFTFKIPVVFHRRSTPSYDKEVTLSLTQASVSHDMNLSAAPEWVTVNVGAVVLAKVKPRVDSEDELSLEALYDPDPASRLWASFALADVRSPLSPIAEDTLAKVVQSDESPYVRAELLWHFQQMSNRSLPTELGKKLFQLAQKSEASDFVKSTQFLKDPHGWTEYRSHLLGALGKVKDKEVLKFLSHELARKDLPLDDVYEATIAVAQTGDRAADKILKVALKNQSERGYPYRMQILIGFGAYENPLAARDIEAFSKTMGSDVLGRIVRAVKDNETLKSCPAWANFLDRFVLTNKRVGDEVKARLLETIEEVKLGHVKTLLTDISLHSDSERLRDLARKMLKTNFAT